MKSTHKKHLGQNFLINQGVIKRIITQCAFTQEDTVVEIGPGEGALTYKIYDHVKQLIAIEKDKTFISKFEIDILAENFIIINSDILKFNFNQFDQKVKVIGNIPYNISTPIVELLIHNRAKITSAHLTTQLEFGLRCAARPNSKDYGALSCFIQFYGDIKIHFKINPASFKPQPKVVSCFLSIHFHDKPRENVDEKLLFKIIRNAFGQRRKTILNALSILRDKESLTKILKSCNLKPQFRAEEIALDDFIKIAQSWN